MPLLDGMPSSKKEWEDALAAAAPVAEQLINSEAMTPKVRSVLALLGEGFSLADVMQLTPAHRDALMLHAARTIEAGDLKQAAEFLEVLHLMDPFDARAPYMLGAIHQHQGNHAQAARLYIAHLALKATNHEVHHRLGECFLAARERQNAIDCFTAAEAFATDAGDAKAAARASAMRQIARDTLSPDADAQADAPRGA